MEPALLLLGHGSKAEEANRELFRIAGYVKETSGISTVEVAFLQLAEPLLERGIKNCMETGVKKIVIMPYFLYIGNHVKKDIPLEIDRIKRENPGVEIVLSGHIGFDKKLGDIVIDRVKGHYSSL